MEVSAGWQEQQPCKRKTGSTQAGLRTVALQTQGMQRIGWVRTEGLFLGRGAGCCGLLAVRLVL